MRTSSIKNESAYPAAKCFGAKGRTIGGVSDVKATGLLIRLMNRVDMVALADKKNPGARPGFEFIARGNYPAGGRYPASTI
jgi:hypothetical protein